MFHVHLMNDGRTCWLLQLGPLVSTCAAVVSLSFFNRLSSFSSFNAYYLTLEQRMKLSHPSVINTSKFRAALLQVALGAHDNEQKRCKQETLKIYPLL